METKGIVKEVRANPYHYCYEVMIETDFLDDVDDLIDVECDITIKKHREKRSLNANSFLWVLCQKLAEKIGHTTREEVYIKMLLEYSKSFGFVVGTEKTLNDLVAKSDIRAYKKIGDIMVNGRKATQYQVFYGSHTFDTEEMSVLLNGVVSECQQVGIPTMPENELAKLYEEWGKNGN